MNQYDKVRTYTFDLNDITLEFLGRKCKVLKAKVTFQKDLTVFAIDGCLSNTITGLNCKCSIVNGKLIEGENCMLSDCSSNDNGLRQVPAILDKFVDDNHKAMLKLGWIDQNGLTRMGKDALDALIAEKFMPELGEKAKAVVEQLETKQKQLETKKDA